MSRVAEIDGLQEAHGHLATGEHAKVERVEVDQHLVVHAGIWLLRHERWRTLGRHLYAGLAPPSAASPVTPRCLRQIGPI